MKITKEDMFYFISIYILADHEAEAETKQTAKSLFTLYSQST
jgi:hypothetical protein